MALEIDAPSDKEAYDHIRWYLLHENVHVFIDHDDDWFLEFETPCSALGEDHLCHQYENRPQICRDHGEEDEHVQCEFHSEEAPHTHRFSKASEFETYLEKQDIQWQYNPVRAGSKKKKKS